MRTTRSSPVHEFGFDAASSGLTEASADPVRGAAGWAGDTAGVAEGAPCTEGGCAIPPESRAASASARRIFLKFITIIATANATRMNIVM